MLTVIVVRETESFELKAAGLEHCRELVDALLDAGEDVVVDAGDGEPVRVLPDW